MAVNTASFKRNRELGFPGMPFNRPNPSSQLEMHRRNTLQLSSNQTFNSSKYSGSIFCLDIESQEERYLLCGSVDGSVYIFDLQHNSKTPSIVYPVIAAVKRQSRHSHRHMVVSCQWYAHDTGIFLTASTDKTLKLWDTNRLKPKETIHFENSLRHHHWSPVSGGHFPMVACAAGISNVYLVDLRTGSTLHQLYGHKETVNCVQFSRNDQNILFSGGMDGQLIAWDVRSGKSYLKALRSVKLNQGAYSRKLSAKVYENRAHSGAVSGLKFTPDGLMLLSCGTDGALRCWNAQTLEEMTDHLGNCALESGSSSGVLPHKLTYFDVAQGPGAQTTVFFPDEDNILAVDLASGQIRNTLHGHYCPVNSCVYRSNYQQLISAGNDRMVLSWVPKIDQNNLFRAHTVGGENVLKSLKEDRWSSEEEI